MFSGGIPTILPTACAVVGLSPEIIHTAIPRSRSAWRMSLASGRTGLATASIKASSHGAVVGGSKRVLAPTRTTDFASRFQETSVAALAGEIANAVVLHQGLISHNHIERDSVLAVAGIRNEPFIPFPGASSTEAARRPGGFIDAAKKTILAQWDGYCSARAPTTPPRYRRFLPHPHRASGDQSQQAPHLQ